MSVDENWFGKRGNFTGFCGQNQGVISLKKLSSQSGLLNKKQRGSSRKFEHRIFLPKVREGGEEVVIEKLT